KNGAELALRLGLELNATVYIKEEFIKMQENELIAVYPIEGGFSAFVGRIFSEYEAIVFVMASGIVVRAIAGCIKDKTSDPAIVVMDEKGQHVISLLSGHIGGANRLARIIAQKTGAVPVITTSTDVNSTIAFDEFAVKNNCAIENLSDLKYISSELVNGEKAGLYSDYELVGELTSNIVRYDGTCSYAVVFSNRTDIDMKDGKTLYIRPRNLILGIGCKKGTAKEQIEAAVQDFMRKNNKSILSLKCAATIDLKKDEKGLLEFCREHSLNLIIIPRDKIASVENNFAYSAFVKKKAGVGSVAEPCALLAVKNAAAVCGKTVYKGITLALSEEEMSFYI
ncbi:MAG: cobalt-precorrin 5A hydrolase, partial [Candidatus Humimicrobiaceae bacterium]